MDTTLLLTHAAEWLGVSAFAWILALIPALKTPPVIFKYARRDGMIALFLGASTLLFAVALSPVGLSGSIDRWLPVSGPASALLHPLVLAALSLLPFIAALLTRGQPALSAGWSAKRMRAGLQTGLTVVLLTVFLRNRVLDIVGGLKTDEVTYLLFALGIALCEETIFRGYIQLRLDNWLGGNRGWIATALMFAAFRFPGLLATGSTSQALFGLLLILGESFTAGWLMRKSGHVLAPALYRAASIWMGVFI